MDGDFYKCAPAVGRKLAEALPSDALKDVLETFAANVVGKLYEEHHLRRSPGVAFAPLPARLLYLIFQHARDISTAEIVDCFDPAVAKSTFSEATECPRTASPLVAAVLCLDILHHGHQRERMPDWVSQASERLLRQDEVPDALKKKIEHAARRLQGLRRDHNLHRIR